MLLKLDLHERGKWVQEVLNAQNIQDVDICQCSLMQTWNNGIWDEMP